MKALVLNGGRIGDNATDAVCGALAGQIQQRGWQVDRIVCRDTKIASCQGCFSCWIRSPGTCIIPDAGRDVAERAVQCDLLVLLSPLTFGGYSSELKKALDRIISNVSPFLVKIDGQYRHPARYDHAPRLLGLGVARRHNHEGERTFRALLARNGLNLHSPRAAAGVVAVSEGAAAVVERIDALLSELGVTS